LARQILNTRTQAKIKKDKQDDIDTKKIQEANSEALLLRATGSDGESNQEVITAARESFATKQITFKQFDQIRKEIEVPDDGIDNQNTILSIKEDIFDGATKDDINHRIFMAREDGNIVGNTAADLYELNAKRTGLDSPFGIEAKQARNFIKESIKDTSPFAKFDEQRAARYANAMREYEQRLLTAEEDGISPNDIADDVVKRYRLEPLKAEAFPRPMFGSRTDPQAARLNTINALDKGDIDKETADRELMNIEMIISANEAAIASEGKL
jgi:hypothetical protein